MKINTNNGFSLIELSIVLIIIGLLVAGITGGASLIKSAELRSTITEVRNYQTAVNAYYTAVGSLPGTDNSSEMNFANSFAAWGSMQNQGIIDSNLTGVSHTSEVSGVTTTTFVFDTNVTSLDTTNSLRSKYKGAYYALGYNSNMKQNVIFLFTPSETPAVLSDAGTVAHGSITRGDAQFIDDKMDNNLIDSGKVRAFNGGSGTPACAYDSDSSKTQDCALAIGIGL